MPQILASISPTHVRRTGEPVEFSIFMMLRNYIIKGFVFISLVSVMALVSAQDSPSKVVSAKAPDVRLVIDVSGSMKRNDPNNLRRPAIELLVQLLPEQSKAGVWTFGKWVNMLVPHKDVSDLWREGAVSKSGEINSVGLFTNIGEALEKASYDAASADDKFRTSIILLTDGMVDIDKDPAANKKEWRRIVDEVLPKLKDAGITVHTIALSDNADTNLLNKLSLSTDGIAAVAKSAEDLMKIFLKAFDVAAPAEQVPLSDEGFVIDSSVEEFTALIFRKNPDEQTQLIGPDEEKLTAASNSKYVNWHRADRYDLITVKQPLEGQWLVKADMDPESRITVVSNLNLRVRELPINAYIDHQLDVSFLLQEDGKTVTSPEFLSLMDTSLRLMAGNDEFSLKEFWTQNVPGTDPPASGVYTVALPQFEKEGIYQLVVELDGKSFVREFAHQFHVRQPFGAEVKQRFVDGRLEYILTAQAYSGDIAIDNTQVVATVMTPDRRKKIYSLQATDVDTWETKLQPDYEGEYIAKIKIRGHHLSGEPFSAELEDVRFNYSLDAGFVEEKEPFFEESPSPEPTPTPEQTVAATPEPTPEPESELEPSATPEPESTGGFQSILIYGGLILGNILLFGLGFLAFRKVLGPKNRDEEILDEFSEEKIAEQLAEEPAPEVVEIPQMEEIEEEPPMEDLEPIDDEPEPEVEPLEQEPEPEVFANEDDAGESDLESDLNALLGDGDAEEPPEDSPMESGGAEVFEESAMDELDDLDAMAMESEDEAESEALQEMSEEDEEEDMVSAMLKAQGLDLAEDELDDAISSLIEDLENDDDIGGDDLDDGYDIDDDIDDDKDR
ncbi:hypothetical protein TDB9533_04376 [Thalassocella blandensis]|nr:hypothetical protein TDB9533_04376 [Thalassocella blandensis]